MQKMFRFLAYGLVGWVLEILFTGSTSVLQGDRAAKARTYLWMHPIYGLAALGLEQVHDRIRWAPPGARAAAYTAIMYAVEYGSGSLLRRFTGSCPWDYGKRPRSIKGLIRLDYAPLWFAVGLIMEPTRDFLEKTEKLLASNHEESLTNLELLSQSSLATASSRASREGVLSRLFSK